jgi:hypothetical protein
MEQLGKRGWRVEDTVFIARVFNPCFKSLYQLASILPFLKTCSSLRDSARPVAE